MLVGSPQLSGLKLLYSAFEDDLMSVLFKGLKTFLLLHFVPSSLALSSSPSLRCVLQSASQIRLFIPSLPLGISPPEHHFHLPQWLWWPVKSESWRVLYMHSNAHAKISQEEGTCMYVSTCTYPLYILATTCRMGEAGEERVTGEIRHAQWNVLTSFAVFIQALKQPLKLAYSARRSALGIAECINYIYNTMDPLPDPADCLYSPHVKPNCNC